MVSTLRVTITWIHDPLQTCGECALHDWGLGHPTLTERPPVLANVCVCCELRRSDAVDLSFQVIWALCSCIIVANTTKGVEGLVDMLNALAPSARPFATLSAGFHRRLHHQTKISAIGRSSSFPHTLVHRNRRSISKMLPITLLARLGT